MLHVEQNLSNEIVLAVLRERLHARAIAKRLKANHMTVSRKLKELVEGNVLDFRIEGRNKIFFLKKTPEARNFVLAAELYKLNRAIERYPRLRAVVERIQRDPAIPLALLFGSHASGTADEESDIDIFIESRDRGLKAGLESLDSKLSVKLGKFSVEDPLGREIEKNHIVIKGAELFYDRIGLFK
ncbi:MAG: nucleotidyltransferase domain-containing protein [Candidatus Hadarchaeales archaeon]